MGFFASQQKRIVEIWAQKSEGFGDTVAKITKTLGINPCPACEKRRKKFNRTISYRKLQRKLERLKNRLFKLEKRNRYD